MSHTGHPGYRVFHGQGESGGRENFFLCQVEGAPRATSSIGPNARAPGRPTATVQEALYMAYRGEAVTSEDKKRLVDDMDVKNAPFHVHVARIHAFLRWTRPEDTKPFVFALATLLRGVRSGSEAKRTAALHKRLKPFGVRLLAEPRAVREGADLLPVTVLLAKVYVAHAASLKLEDDSRDPWSHGKLPSTRQVLWLQSDITIRALTQTQEDDPVEDDESESE